MELSDIVGTHDFGYGQLNKTNNNQFVASSGYDGLVQIRKATDLVSEIKFELIKMLYLEII